MERPSALTASVVLITSLLLMLRASRMMSAPAEALAFVSHGFKEVLMEQGWLYSAVTRPRPIPRLPPVISTFLP